MENLFNQIAEAVRPKVKGFPILKGKKQNYYIFSRTRAIGIYAVGVEYDGAWANSVDVALTYMEGDGWNLFTVTKHEQV